MFGSQLAFAPSWKDEDAVIRSLLEKVPGDIPVEDGIHTLLLPEIWTQLPSHEAVSKVFDGRKASVNFWARFNMEYMCKLYEKIVGRYRAWIVSTRREHDVLLGKMPVLSWNERFGVFRIAPLAHWGTESIQAKVRQYPAATTEPQCTWNDGGIASRRLESPNEIMNTWNRTDAAEYAVVMAELIPPSQALNECYAQAQSVKEKGLETIMDKVEK